VEGLLLLARAEAGVLRMDRQPVDLTQLAEEVYWRLKVLADSRSIRFESELGDPVVIRGDRERLRRLLFNLVDNAIKYTRQGGAVSLSVRSGDGSAAVEISDTGPGIPAEELEKVFLPFHRIPETGPEAVRGAGLGLSIARSIAAAHGGLIRVESAPGRGSTFSVLIPLDSETPA
jgi:signal transduction histidine kinase